MRKIYITDDGTHFDTEKAALVHESSVPIRKHILNKWEKRPNRSSDPLPKDWLAFMVEVVQEYLPTQVATKRTKRTKKVYITVNHIKQVEALSHLRQKQVADIVGISTTSVWRIRSKQLTTVDGALVRVPRDKAALLRQGKLNHEDWRP